MRSSSCPTRSCRRTTCRSPRVAIKFNWTLSTGGITRNIIPELATASADVRVNKVADLEVVDKAYRERIASNKKLVPDTKVEAGFERRRAPLEATDASRAVTKKAQAIYAELGRKLARGRQWQRRRHRCGVRRAVRQAGDRRELRSRGLRVPLVRGEYVELDTIEPRLYLLTRLVMDTAQGK